MFSSGQVRPGYVALVQVRPVYFRFGQFSSG
jgi:hypothetical protein